ncbi:MAG: hypothetical protein U5P41_08240 [Gammaproteobacteria bacterium]|nr:hypothetical protein [Gammaproteobacteria bacterium]
MPGRRYGRIKVGDRTYTPGVRAAPGNDFQWQYRQQVSLDETRTITEATVTPSLRTGMCAGNWEPSEAIVELSHLVPEKEQDFNYDVGLQEFRTPVATLLSLSVPLQGAKPATTTTMARAATASTNTATAAVTRAPGTSPGIRI